MEVQIYPASQLGGEERAFQDVQQGVIQIASLASNNAAVFAPSLYVIDLPYLFRTNQEGWAILDKYWDELNAKTIKESGNRIIGWLDLGYRHVCNSKRPIRTIEDLKGLKIRVPNNPIMIATFRAWGGEPAPMAWDETFNALQQKVVDLERRLNPEKRGSVYDMKFQKTWMDSCDEAERAQIGQACYRAYMVGTKVCTFLWVALLILNFVFDFGMLPIAAVLVVWGVMQTVCALECIRLSKRKGEM